MPQLHLFIILFVILSAWKPSNAWAVEAFETNGNLIINDPQQSDTFILPEEMKKSASYQLTIYPHASLQMQEGEKEKGGVSDLNTLIQKANKSYLDGNYNDSLGFLLQAYDQAPKDVRVNNMLGSIFFKMQDYKMARYYWETSLKLDPSQKEVQLHLQKMPAATAAQATPSSSSTPPPQQTPAPLAPSDEGGR